MNAEEIKRNILKKEENLSKYASLSKNSIRISDDYEEDIRPAYFRDIDRIIHSLSYTRYMDKTQVFSYNNNDNLSKRIVHVQLVSKIARTIGRALNLNEDLIEAMSLGHDIGHTPLGHFGEKVLNEISQEYLGEMFNHNIQGVRQFMVLENNGLGNNLSIQVLDGVMCHNGEMLNNVYEPINKTKEEFINEYEKCYTDKEILRRLRPMTLEGCIVRISDVIGYIGRDIEDAIRLGVIKREQIPENVTKVLGSTNKEIVNALIVDIIENSYNQNYIKLSEENFNALYELKAFNYQYIYSKANPDYKNVSNEIKELFCIYLEDLNNKNIESDIYQIFLNKMTDDYQKNTKNERIVIDYIAGMTDKYLKEKINVRVGEKI